MRERAGQPAKTKEGGSVAGKAEMKEGGPAAGKSGVQEGGPAAGKSGVKVEKAPVPGPSGEGSALRRVDSASSIASGMSGSASSRQTTPMMPRKRVSEETGSEGDAESDVPFKRRVKAGPKSTKGPASRQKEEGEADNLSLAAAIAAGIQAIQIAAAGPGTGAASQRECVGAAIQQLLVASQDALIRLRECDAQADEHEERRQENRRLLEECRKSREEIRLLKEERERLRNDVKALSKDLGATKASLVQLGQEVAALSADRGRKEGAAPPSPKGGGKTPPRGGKSPPKEDEVFPMGGTNRVVRVGDLEQLLRSLIPAILKEMGVGQGPPTPQPLGAGSVEAGRPPPPPPPTEGGKKKAKRGGGGRGDGPPASRTRSSGRTPTVPPPPAVVPAQGPAPPVGEQWSKVVGRRSGTRPPRAAPARVAPSGPGAASGGARAKEVPPARARRIRVPSMAAVTLKCVGVEYAAMLKKAREEISLEALGIEDLMVRRGVTGALVIEVPGPDTGVRADALASAMRRTLAGEGEAVKIGRPCKRAALRIRDLPPDAIPGQIVSAMADVGGCQSPDIDIGPITNGAGGLGTCVIRCPLVAATKVAQAGRVKIGWTRVRVALLARRPLQCFRCLEAGHVRDRCTNPTDRSGACYRCGKEGHTARECVAQPACPACAHEGLPATHKVGGSACKASRRGKSRGAAWTTRREASTKVATPEARPDRGAAQSATAAPSVPPPSPPATGGVVTQASAMEVEVLAPPLGDQPST